MNESNELFYGLSIKPEVQKIWGWFVVLYVFLAGLGGGTFLFSFVMLFVDRFNDAARIGVFLGPILVLIGTLLLVFDLGSPLRAYRIFYAARSTWMTSWLVRGAWLLSAFIILGLAYALPAWDIFAWLPWTQTSSLGQGIGITAAILSLFVMVYPGLLLGVNRSIPLWNTSALPPLFFFSGLDTGLAAFVLMSSTLPSNIGIDGFHLLAGMDCIILFILLIVLASYLELVRQSGETAAVSVQLLLSPLFIWAVIVAGLLVPLVLLLFGLAATSLATIRFLDTVASVLILNGGLLLRFGVVKSGVRMPLI
jgi:formate-dependent nitrite reductase membrane component NrfD